MKWLKTFVRNEKGSVADITAAVGILITLIICILIFYNIAGSIDTTTLDAEFTGTPSSNATDDVIGQAATFFQIAPILVIVIVAVVILKYVGMV